MADGEIERSTSGITQIGKNKWGEGEIKITPEAAQAWKDTIQHELTKIKDEILGKIDEKVVTPWSSAVPQVKGAEELTHAMRNTAVEQFRLDVGKYGEYLEGMLTAISSIVQQKLDYGKGLTRD